MSAINAKYILNKSINFPYQVIAVPVSFTLNCFLPFYRTSFHWMTTTNDLSISGVRAGCWTASNY